MRVANVLSHMCACAPVQRPGRQVVCSPLPPCLFRSLPEPSLLMFSGWAGSHPPAYSPYSSGHSGVRLCPARYVGAESELGVMAAQLSHPSSPSRFLLSGAGN